MVVAVSVFIYASVIASSACLLSSSMLNTYMRMAETCSRIIIYLYIIVPNYSAVVLVMCNVIFAPS